MRRMISILLVLVTVFALALPAAAESSQRLSTKKEDLLPHNHPYRHKFLMFWECPDTTADYRLAWDEEMTQGEMEECVLAAPELIPEDCDVRPGRITKLESKGITCGEYPFTLTMRVWGTLTCPVMVFFKGEDDTEWRLMGCNIGTDITIEFPSAGYYAVARAW